MGGPNVARQALERGLVDTLELQLVPVLLGSGSSLFAGLDRHVELDAVLVARAPSMTRLRYHVRPRGQ